MSSDDFHQTTLKKLREFLSANRTSISNIWSRDVQKIRKAQFDVDECGNILRSLKLAIWIRAANITLKEHETLIRCDEKKSSMRFCV